MSECCVDRCRNSASWAIHFTSAPAKDYLYCNWHATRNKGVLVWRESAVASSERI